MPIKQTTPEQHAMLHKHWPNDCCLCNKEIELEEAKNILKECCEKLNKLYESGDLYISFYSTHKKIVDFLEK